MPVAISSRVALRVTILDTSLFSSQSGHEIGEKAVPVPVPIKSSVTVCTGDGYLK